MTPNELRRKLKELMALPAETEWVEFKEAKNNIHFGELGKYFSALSNEANLRGLDFGWLVLGITNKPPRKIVGTLGIKLLDHIIFNHKGYYRFLENEQV